MIVTQMRRIHTYEDVHLIADAPGNECRRTHNPANFEQYPEPDLGFSDFYPPVMRLKLLEGVWSCATHL